MRAELPDVLLQWEDFATPHALPILERYRDQLLLSLPTMTTTATLPKSWAALSAGRRAGRYRACATEPW